MAYCVIVNQYDDQIPAITASYRRQRWRGMQQIRLRALELGGGSVGRADGDGQYAFIARHGILGPMLLTEPRACLIKQHSTALHDVS